MAVRATSGGMKRRSASGSAHRSNPVPPEVGEIGGLPVRMRRNDEEIQKLQNYERILALGDGVKSVAIAHGDIVNIIDYLSGGVEIVPIVVKGKIVAYATNLLDILSSEGHEVGESNTDVDSVKVLRKPEIREIQAAFARGDDPVILSDENAQFLANFFMEVVEVDENNTSVDLGSGARDARFNMLNAADIAALQDHDLKKLFRAVAVEVKKRGLEDDANEPPRPVSVLEPAPSIDTAAVETTKPEKPHWKDVRLPGEELGGFIKRDFAPELAAGIMARPMLNRYRGLYQDFDNWRRRYPAEVPPELRSLPKKSEANDRFVAEGKVAFRPDAPLPPRTDEMRSYERDRKRVAAATRRRVTAG